MCKAMEDMITDEKITSHPYAEKQETDVGRNSRISGTVVACHRRTGGGTAGKVIKNKTYAGVVLSVFGECCFGIFYVLLLAFT